MALEPIDPQTAVALYLEDREHDVRKSTIRGHRSRLGHFLRWCEEKGIVNLNVLTGRLLHEYRIWRREDGDLAVSSERTQMATLRVFIRWLTRIDGAEPNLHLKVTVPTLGPDGYSSDAIIDTEVAEKMLAHLEVFEYATKDHVIVSLLWHTMIRSGGLRALDVEDFDPDERYLSLVNRPETGTYLKNGKSGQRLVGLSDEICSVLDDYLSYRRLEKRDEFDREPLLTTCQGRISASTIRNVCYAWSRPCVTDLECPHDRAIDECKAAIYRGSGSECPSTEGAHALRRGGITNFLGNGVPKNVIRDRVNVSMKVLDRHYDERSEKRRMEQRREYLENSVKND